MVKYEPVAEHRYDSAFGCYEAYGIRVMVDGRAVRTVGDISTDKDKIEALAEKYNTQQLSPLHLSEAIEDFLYDFEV